MKHTDAEVEDAARRFERLADNLDPAGVTPEDLSNLRAVAEAAEQLRPSRDSGRLAPKAGAEIFTDRAGSGDMNGHGPWPVAYHRDGQLGSGDGRSGRARLHRVR